MTVAAWGEDAYLASMGATKITRTTHIFAIVSLLCVAHGGAGAEPFGDEQQPRRNRTLEVAGTGVHMFTTAIVHTETPTATGKIQTSTESVELSGDLRGRILYHPTSVYDFTNGTLVNTGHQVFSGTILDSEPTLVHDGTFKFEVDLATGATSGSVHLTRTLAGPRIRCDLTVTGTGMTPEGNATFAYAGRCRQP